MILVIDERKGALRDDLSNVDLATQEFERLLERAQSGTEPSVIIRIQQDGVYADSADDVTMVCVKSEAELSSEQAEHHKSLRKQEHSGPAVSAIERFQRMWTKQ